MGKSKGKGEARDRRLRPLTAPSPYIIWAVGREVWEEGREAAGLPAFSIIFVMVRTV
jgi:hypothetical protein